LRRLSGVELTAVATLPAPLVTVLATPVATDTTSDVATEKTLAASLVISEIMEAKDAPMNDKSIVEGRIMESIWKFEAPLMPRLYGTERISTAKRKQVF
jgi:hypothetical protein